MREPSLLSIRSQELLERLVDAFKIRMVWKNKESRVVDCNQAFAEDAGFHYPSELIGKSENELPWGGENGAYHMQTDRAVMRTGQPILSYEQELLRAGNRKSWILTSKMPLRDANDEINGVVVMYQDMTFFRDLERAKTKLDRAFNLLSDANRAIIEAMDEPSLFRQICDFIVKNQYRMAWIGLLENDAAKSVRPVASAGMDAAYVAQIRVSWADDEFGRGPTGTAAREGRTVVNQNFLTNPAMAPWRDNAIQHGFQSSIAVPLKTDTGDVFAVLNIYAAEPESFDADETAKMNELAETLSFGHTALRERNRLPEVLEKTIAAMAATVESRDPYTAGHQHRVADLAVAIATEMGLDAESVKGIRLAGMVHDLGKIHVPLDFLTTPIKLTPAEMAVIRTHPDTGYQILKDIPFPWPVAEMVRQHHERIDGSGYPRGLKGDEILPGAKILAVADVVEAISSHRPYRAAKGLDEALSEIEAQRGIQFDPATVDGCLRLFRERGHRL